MAAEAEAGRWCVKTGKELWFIKAVVRELIVAPKWFLAAVALPRFPCVELKRARAAQFASNFPVLLYWSSEGL